MEHMVTGRWSGRRHNGRACTVTEVTQYDRPGVTASPAWGSYLLVDHEPTERLAKGQYLVLPGNEVVTCDDPDAP
jgi:hypothetical protein